MSHVDEGRLHAYLDGEVPAGAERRALETHLVSCVSCRAALIEARALRQRSSEVLRQSGPPEDTAPPPFEEIRQRSRARSVGRETRRLSRFRMLAWAATVVIAAGVGSVVTLQFRADAPQSAFRALEDVGSPEAEESASASRLPALVGGRSESARSAETLQLSDRAAPANRAAPAATTPALDQRMAAKAERRDEEPAPGVGLPSAEKVVAQASRANEVQRKADTAAVEPVAPAPAEADVGGVLARARPLEPAAADSDVRAEPRREAAGMTVRAVGRADEPATKWTEVTRETAAAALGGTVANIEGLAVVRYGLREVAGIPQVRIAQRTESGVEVELVQWRTRDGPIASEFLPLPAAQQVPDSLATVTVERADYTIRARAKVSPQALRDLVQRIP